MKKETAALKEYNSFMKSRNKEAKRQNKQSLKEIRRYNRQTSYGRIAFKGLERVGALRMSSSLAYAIAKRSGHPAAAAAIDKIGDISVMASIGFTGREAYNAHNLRGQASEFHTPTKKR